MVDLEDFGLHDFTLACTQEMSMAIKIKCSPGGMQYGTRSVSRLSKLTVHGHGDAIRDHKTC